jgi:K+-transporting ATPase c subunit
MWFLPISLIVFSVVLLCIVCPLILWAIQQTVFPFRSKPSKNASVAWCAIISSDHNSVGN